MVGVCLTVIGILSIITTFNKIDTLGDEITAIDAIIFLGSCIISYAAIKTKERKRANQIFLDHSIILFIIKIRIEII